VKPYIRYQASDNATILDIVSFSKGRRGVGKEGRKED